MTDKPAQAIVSCPARLATLYNGHSRRRQTPALCTPPTGTFDFSGRTLSPKLHWLGTRPFDKLHTSIGGKLHKIQSSGAGREYWRTRLLLRTSPKLWEDRCGFSQGLKRSVSKSDHLIPMGKMTLREPHTSKACLAFCSDIVVHLHTHAYVQCAAYRA